VCGHVQRGRGDKVCPRVKDKKIENIQMIFEVGYKGTEGYKEYNIAWNITKTSVYGFQINSAYEYLIATLCCPWCLVSGGHISS
jgi:hypothetical protein